MHTSDSADDVGIKQQVATDATREMSLSKIEQQPKKTSGDNHANCSKPRSGGVTAEEDSSGTSGSEPKDRKRAATPSEADPDAISPEWAKAQVARFGVQGPLLHDATEKLRAEVASLLAKKLKPAKMAKLAKQAITNSLTSK